METTGKKHIKTTPEEVFKIMKEAGMYRTYILNKEDEVEYSWSDGVYAMAKAIVLQRKGIFDESN